MFAGGGTGGHLFIAISLARELLRGRSDRCVLFVGTRRGLESRIVPQEGFDLDFIESAGLKGMKAPDLLRNMSVIPRSLWQSHGLIKKHLPDVVVGVGGYASGPVVLVAALRRVPTLIVEPNAYPGLTNRLLSRVVDRVALALPDEGGFFGKKGVVTGIPVREEFLDMKPHGRCSGRLNVLIFGGSQGSRALNSIVCDALPELVKLGDRLSLIHQTGEKDLQRVLRAYRNAGVDGDVRAFMPEIYREMQEADLVVCRAGAGAVAEITAAGRAAILVPFPQAADDHQTKNALALEKKGAARMIREAELKPGRLGQEIQGFMEDHGAIERMERAARSLARPDAGPDIAGLIAELAAERRAGTAKYGKKQRHNV